MEYISIGHQIMIMLSNVNSRLIAVWCDHVVVVVAVCVIVGGVGVIIA